MNIIDLEKPKGVIVSLGGQTAINLAERLDTLGVPIIGTDCEAIAKAENRKLIFGILAIVGLFAGCIVFANVGGFVWLLH